MTSAPVPGVSRRAEASAVAATVVTITVRGESWRVAPFNLPLSEALWLRKATGGMSIESFWSGSTAIGLDSVKVLWCLARRAAGETSLTLEDAWAQWPDDLAPDEFDVTADDQESDDPEA